MTRFQKEISGQLGEFWKKNAEKEAAQAKEMFERKAYVTANGVVRWNSNNKVPFDDMLEKMEYAGCTFDRDESNMTREVEVQLELEEMRRKPAVHSQEEIEEMKEAFGTGSVVVNVLTGERIKL